MAASNPAIEWGRVTAHAERILIAGAGPSLEELQMECVAKAAAAGVHVIAVNHIVFWLPVVHSWFTLDPSKDVRTIMRNRRRGTRYYAAVPNDYGLASARLVMHRKPIEAGITYLRRLTGDGPLSARHSLCDDPHAIHTGNSVWGALGLAWHMKPRAIGVVGLDGTDEEYAFRPGRPRGKLDHLPGLFASALPQLAARGVEVFNGSLHSKITAFERMRPADAIQRLITTGASHHGPRPR